MSEVQDSQIPEEQKSFEADSDDLEESLGFQESPNQELEETAQLVQFQSARGEPKPQHKEWYEREPTWKWQSTELPDAFQKEKIRLLAATWNMHGKPSPNTLDDILRPDIPHHMYVICAQECMRSIASSLIFKSKKEWEFKVSQTLGENYFVVESGSVGATHLIVFAHKSLEKLIGFVEHDTVATGVGNIVSNKGGIGISFKLGHTKLMVVGVHLAAGQKNSKKRTEDWLRIEKQLGIPCYYPKAGLASDRVDAALLLGDLNYRINGSREAVELLIREEVMQPLKNGEQLSKEIQNGFFSRYKEGSLDFVPTYRFDVGTLTYDSSKKQRIPAWTDRILYKDPEGVLSQQSYDSVMHNTESDHKPVFSQFKLKFVTHYHPQDTIGKTKKSKACQLF